jgi:hypothetical protein
MVMEQKVEGEQADINSYLKTCEDARESKIQFIPLLFRVKVFMAMMKTSWSQPGRGVVNNGLGMIDGVCVYGRAGGAPYT